MDELMLISIHVTVCYSVEYWLQHPLLFAIEEHTHLSLDFTHSPQHADVLQQISVRQHLLPQLLIYRHLPFPQDLIHPETHIQYEIMHMQMCASVQVYKRACMPAH